ncbi:hypothetical protein EOD41_13925 [Mucilaginibacter limnophilus]|uniref:Uncharacterized protein n=1 Tax=Mucilaginibacter limnophilus TaxID=1932778 RepID=A0A3S2UK36_9SPHI|nr:hypothetical protein [Mucilaginibacter limnophilus]RVU00054.1 hypothetical protein EOD41_13925 [Mucilaginibacter limnophilus]
MTHDLSGLKSGLLRIIIYGVFIYGLAEVIRWDAAAKVTINEAKVSEASFTEFLQSIFLAISAALYLGVFFKYEQLKPLAFFLFSFALASFIREQDSWLDERVFNNAWQVGVFSLLAVLLYYLWRNGTRFLQTVSLYVNSLPFGLMLAGFLTTYIFSRLYGRTKFWEEVMEERYFRTVKNVSEESIELLGYFILVIAAIEFFLCAKHYVRKITETIKQDRAKAVLI